MSWINKLIYYNNVDDPEEFDIGTTFDKVYYKNKEGTITNFSLADFVGHIKDFFNEKRFMLWGNDQPEKGSNTVEWYQTEIIKNPIPIPLVIDQTANYDNDTPIQPGIYTLKRSDPDSNAPLFSSQDGKNKFETINFTLENEHKQEKQRFNLLNKYYLDSESKVNDSNDFNDYYSYILQNDITGNYYFIEIKIAYDKNDKEDRAIEVIWARPSSSTEKDWKRYDPLRNEELADPTAYIDFEFEIEKYYTINFKIEENSQENFLTLYATPDINEKYLWANIEKPEVLNDYSWITQDGSSYDISDANETEITGDLTLFAASNSSSNQETDGEQNQGTDEEQNQGTEGNN